jgi:hypothetical protein
LPNAWRISAGDSSPTVDSHENATRIDPSPENLAGDETRVLREAAEESTITQNRPNLNPG